MRQCCEPLKLIKKKTWFCVQVFTSRRIQSTLISLLSDQADPLVCHTDSDFLILNYKLLKAAKLSCYDDDNDDDDDLLMIMLEFEAFLSSY